MTSTFRYLPCKDIALKRHLAPDHSCKVGLVALDIEHAAILTFLVTELSKKATLVDRRKLSVKYKVYVLNSSSSSKSHKERLNGIKVTSANMRQIAEKCSGNHCARLLIESKTPFQWVGN